MSCQVDKDTKKKLFVLCSDYFLRAFEEIVSSIILITKKLIIAFEKVWNTFKEQLMYTTLWYHHVLFICNVDIFWAD